MILGMTISTFTQLHVIISLIGIVSGLIALAAMMRGQHLSATALVFLATTILTSATGFLFPFQTILPSHIVGAISLVVLAVAMLALYVFDLTGAWRAIYVISATLALYLNVFVAVVQAFLKIEPLHQLAPNQNEPPFVVAQAVVALLFLFCGWIAVRRFHPHGILQQQLQ